MPDIVYIDDEPEALLSKATPEQRARVHDVAYDPDDPNAALASLAGGANLWLFDFFLVDGPEQDSPDNENGLSLFQRGRRASEGGRPTTVVVSSAPEQAIGTSLPRPERRHVIAQQLGVEWIGGKDAATIGHVLALADAVRTISEHLTATPGAGEVASPYDEDSLCFEVLGAPRGVDWEESIRREVDRARPPREVPLSAPARGRVIVSWLLSHVLPYPSFLLSDAQAALRLSLKPESFRALATLSVGGRRSKVRQSLEASRYRGPLAGFLGPRWWRAGIDDLVWQLSQAKEGYRDALRRLGTGTELEFLEHEEPVLLFDEDLIETDTVGEAGDCVRAAEEDFPANVEAAWVSRDAARANRALAAKVLFEDRRLLGLDE